MPPDHRLNILQDTREGLEPQGTTDASWAAVRGALTPGPGLDGLYLHVPFCFHKCHYCDFYSLVDGPGRDRQPAFTDALCAELNHHAGLRSPGAATPRTVFVGGGTPTLLRPELWGGLLDSLHAGGWLDACDEFTVEANPETVTPELLGRLAAGGVNRVSIGAQSFDPRHLKTLERWHDPANVPRAVDAARAAGIGSVSLDLIFGTPGQSLADLDADLDAALACDPDHLSVYALIYEPNTPMTARLHAGDFSRVDEDTDRAMYEHVIERLGDAGYEHYEVSNYAKPGRRALHNLAYWRNLDWLGCGPGAASHVAGLRWKNQPSLDRYNAGSPTPPVTQVERLDDDARRGEALMLGLRLLDGIALPDLDTLLADDEARRGEIDRLVDLALLERTATHLRLTRRGLMVADSVLAELV